MNRCKNEYKKEEIVSTNIFNYTRVTVGDLKKFIEKFNVPDNAVILVQRVNDYYFLEGKWKVYKKEGEFYNNAIERNQELDAGVYHNKEDYPDLENPEILRTNKEQLEDLKEEYVPIASPVFYKDDKNDFLFLDLHY